MKIDTHGLKMIGLRKASGFTETYSLASGMYTQISYDTATGEILPTFHYSYGYNSWTEYHDDSVIFICFTRHHLKMQLLADIIAGSLAIDHKNPWKIC